MRNSRTLTLLAIPLALLIAGCAAKAPEGLKAQSLETEVIEAPRDKVFRAIRNAIMNEGFDLRFSEMQSGTLTFDKPYHVADSDKTSSWILQVCPYTAPAGALWGKEIEKKEARNVEVSVIMDDLGDKTEVRTKISSPGGVSSTQEYARQITKIYAGVREQFSLKGR
jgi:hypothetical protein